MSLSGADVSRSFKAVFIPADKSKSVEEWVITYNNASEVSCVLDRLKAHFAGGSAGVDHAALRESVRQQIKDTLMKQNPEAASKPIDDAMVDMVLQMSAVDCVALQNNKASTGYIGLMMYVDDQGKAKDLPVNERATTVTMECGCPTRVLGDTLIARNFDDENSFHRVDFTLEEYFTAKEWRLQARKANEEKGANANSEQTQQLKDLMAKAKLGQGAATDSADMANLLDAASKRLANQPAAPPAVKSCSNPACERDAHMRCGRCKRSWYCSAECQKKDFKFHKANVCIPKDAAPVKDAPATTADAPAAAAPAEADAKPAESKQ